MPGSAVAKAAWPSSLTLSLVMSPATLPAPSSMPWPLFTTVFVIASMMSRAGVEAVIVSEWDVFTAFSQG